MIFQKILLGGRRRCQWLNIHREVTDNMCGIFASYSKDAFIELAKANAYRGQHSFSLTIIDSNKSGETIRPLVIRRMGSFDYSIVPNDGYKIGHIQAPTGPNQSTNIHPAQLESCFLWHNGIIKEYDCDRLRKKQMVDTQWDTMLLLHEALDLKNCKVNLSSINGSFACLMIIDGRIFVFRNVLSPMFYDGFNFSSVKTNLTTKAVPSEKLFEINFNDDNSLKLIDTFSTKENPYFGLED